MLTLFLGAGALGCIAYGVYQYTAYRELRVREEQHLSGGYYTKPRAYQGAWYRVPPSEVYSSGITEGNIPALHRPEIVSVAEADSVVADDLGGVAIEINGEARFYPAQVMNWHEVVHDVVGGVPVLVYYAPLTGVAAVYELPQGKTFSVSGQEYNNDVLLREEGTEILWSGILGMPVVAPSQADMLGTLTLLPSSFVPWKEWKNAYPNGSVLSFATGYDRDYTRHPYGNYETSPGIYFPVNHAELPVRAKEAAYVVSFETGIAAVGLSTSLLLDSTPNVTLEGRDIVFFMEQRVDAIPRVFDARIEGKLLTFQRANSTTFVDNETRSTWNLSGQAIAGDLKGEQLFELPLMRMYAFAADAFFPNITFVGEEYIFAQENDEGSIEIGE